MMPQAVGAGAAKIGGNLAGRAIGNLLGKREQPGAPMGGDTNPLRALLSQNTNSNFNYSGQFGNQANSIMDLLGLSDVFRPDNPNPMGTDMQDMLDKMRRHHGGAGLQDTFMDSLRRAMGGGF